MMAGQKIVMLRNQVIEDIDEGLNITIRQLWHAGEIGTLIYSEVDFGDGRAYHAGNEGRDYEKIDDPLPAPALKESNPKDAIGCRKVSFSVLPWRVIHGVALAMLEGACKYGKHNYRAVGVRASVYFDACIARHLSQWWEGEDIDKESGLHHVDKAIACLMVMRDSMLAGNFVDDRPYNGSLNIEELNKKAGQIIDLHSGKKPTHFTKQNEGKQNGNS